jgi:hypothetical protein
MDDHHQTKQFVTKVSSDTMAEESKKATEEAMKTLASQMAKVPLPLEEECFLEDEHTTDSDSSFEDQILTQKKRRRVNSRPLKSLKTYNTFQQDSTKALETRIHYLKLDLVNAEVALSEANDKLLVMQRKQNVFITIEEEFMKLRELIANANKGNGPLTFEQLEHKYLLFVCDSRVACQVVSLAVSKVEYPSMKYSLQNSILSEKEHIQQTLTAMEWQMYKKRAIHVSIIASLILFTILLSLILVTIATDTLPYWRSVL